MEWQKFIYLQKQNKRQGLEEIVVFYSNTNLSICRIIVSKFASVYLCTVRLQKYFLCWTYGIIMGTLVDNVMDLWSI